MSAQRNKHGDTQFRPDVHNTPVRWFQPSYTAGGKWVTQAEWDQIYSGTATPPASAPQTGATVKGYRTLTTDETEMMNQLKSTSAGFLAQLAVVQKAIDAQYAAAKQSGNVFELDRLDNACPRKWLAKAITSMQEACMFGCRSVAQPSGDS